MQKKFEVLNGGQRGVDNENYDDYDTEWIMSVEG